MLDFQAGAGRTNHLEVFKKYMCFHVGRNYRMCFIKNRVLKNLTKFTAKYLCPSLFFNKVAGRVTLAQVFSCEYCEIFKNTNFEEQLRGAVSGNLMLNNWSYLVYFLLAFQDKSENFNSPPNASSEKTHQEQYFTNFDRWFYQ